VQEWQTLSLECERAHTTEGHPCNTGTFPSLAAPACSLLCCSPRAAPRWDRVVAVLIGGNTGASQTATAATITVSGQSMTVLTNGQGLTLYYRTSDTPASACSGSCASAWPPVISKTIPAAPAGFPGKLGLLNDANGSQVTYNGHPLYTFSGDSGPGRANGQGIGNVWFVVTTDLPA
jgi:predicted lipoprotein with Yx(FWY)xxD motif